MTSDGVDHDEQPDEITLDPEVTSAADGRWITELRERARTSNQSIAEMLVETRRPPPPPPVSPHPQQQPQPSAEAMPDLTDDDEITVDRSKVAAATKQAMRHAMSAEDPIAAATFAPPPAAPGSPSPAPPDVPASDNAPAPRTGVAIPRWEPPPRLVVAPVVTPPALLSIPSGSRPARGLLIGVAILTAAVLVAIWLLATSGTDSVVPDDTVVPGESVVPGDSVVPDASVAPGDPAAVPDPSSEEP